MFPTDNQISQVIEELLAQNTVAGVAVAVTDRNGLRYCRAFGSENIEYPTVPNHTDALYRVASITKITVSIAIQQLAEQGLLSLDDLVKTHLPNLTLSRPKAEKQLTIKHLLTHTGGFVCEDWLEEGPCDETAFEKTILDSVAVRPMHALPCENVYCYSNAGYNLLALLISKILGQPFSKVMNERVLQPLGMEKSTFELPVAATHPISQPHRTDKNGNLYTVHRQRMNSVYYGAGGLYSNVHDLCAVARLFLNNGVNDRGERVLAEESIGAMLKKQCRRNVYEHYGYGIMTREKDGLFLQGHTGNYDPYNSSLFFNLESGYGVSTLINTAGCEALRYDIPERIFSMLNQ